ncbi:MAG TPA: hypothetical protein VLI55_15725 [Bryobacteraceae bacterium]|nr:hypothetical protein [Bryobacteraceae bacterium]
MKGVWTKGDWQRGAITIVPFSADEASRMLQELRKMRSVGIIAALQRTPRNIHAAGDEGRQRTGSPARLPTLQLAVSFWNFTWIQGVRARAY